MSLKDAVIKAVWTGENYRVNKPEWNGGRVLPVAALRERLEKRLVMLNIVDQGDGWVSHAKNEIHYLLAELEGLS